MAVGDSTATSLLHHRVPATIPNTLSIDILLPYMTAREAFRIFPGTKTQWGMGFASSSTGSQRRQAAHPTRPFPIQ
jgi:hypothetical protein